MASTASVMKELQGLLRKAEVTFRGQVEIFLDDGERDAQEESDRPEDLLIFYFNITPSDGLYKNATCKFRAIVDVYNYPQNPPVVQCLTNIYHPNIDLPENEELGNYESSNICVSLLGEDWEPEVGLDGSVMAVLFLFYHPQIDDALSTVCCNFEMEAEYEMKLYKALRGEEVDGFNFDRLIEEDEEKNEDDDDESVSQEVVDEVEKIQITVKVEGSTEGDGKEVAVNDSEIIVEGTSCENESKDEEKNRMNEKLTASSTSDKLNGNENQTNEDISSQHGAHPNGNFGEREGIDDNPASTEDNVTDLVPSGSPPLDEKENMVDAEANKEQPEEAELMENVLSQESQNTEQTLEVEVQSNNVTDPMLNTNDSCGALTNSPLPEDEKESALTEQVYKVRSRTFWYYLHRCLTKVKNQFSRSFCTLTRRTS